MMINFSGYCAVITLVASSKVVVLVRSVNSSSENFKISAIATTSFTTVFISSRLAQSESRKFGSNEKNPPDCLTRRIASMVVERDGSLINAIEQQCKKSPAWKFGKSPTSKNWSALGFTIKVKLRSPLSNPTITVEVRWVGSKIIWSVETFSAFNVSCINLPSGSNPTRPIKPASQPKRATPTATFAGAPPAHFK